MTKSHKDLIPVFFGQTSSTYDVIVKWTTLGRDECWKKEILRIIPKDSQSILDLACGTGILTRKIAQKFPKANIIGIDMSETYLQVAKTYSDSPSNIVFMHDDAEKINLGQKFDCIVSSYIPKYCNAEILVNRCIAHLNADGIIILHDFLYPTNSGFQKIWQFYFKLLRVLGFFLPDWKNVFVELPKLIKQSHWIQELEILLNKNNFDVEKRVLTIGSVGILIGKKHI